MVLQSRPHDHHPLLRMIMTERLEDYFCSPSSLSILKYAGHVKFGTVNYRPQSPIIGSSMLTLFYTLVVLHNKTQQQLITLILGYILRGVNDSCTADLHQRKWALNITGFYQFSLANSLTRSYHCQFNVPVDV